MTINERHFIGFIRFALMGGDYPRGMLTRASWQEQRRLAKEQTVSGLLYQTVTQLPQELRPPQQILMKLYSKVVYYENMNQLLNERTLEIFKKYREIGLHPILLQPPRCMSIPSNVCSATSTFMCPTRKTVSTIGLHKTLSLFLTLQEKSTCCRSIGEVPR